MAKKVYKTDYEYKWDVMYVLAKGYLLYAGILLLLVIIDNLFYYFK